MSPHRISRAPAADRAPLGRRVTATGVALALITSLTYPVIAGPAAAATVAAPAAANFRPAPIDGIKDSYLVVLKTEHPQDVDQMAADLLAQHPGKLRHTYHHAVRGFSVTMTEETARKLSAEPTVEFVEQDLVWHFLDEQIDPPWGLDTLDSRAGAPNSYRYDTSGSGVHAYIMDSGTRITHADFAGRASGDISVFHSEVDTWGTDDCNGHGTAMASIVGGTKFGVAKRVRLHTVRIGGCIGSTAEAFIAGADWVVANALRPAVVNLSGQTRASEMVDRAAASMVAAGIPVVAAAGNSDNDACDFSPGRLPEVITVGASTPLVTFPDWNPLPGTSLGPCVDIFAPGDRIRAATRASDNATTWSTGTSPATAHVTGAVTRFLDGQPTATPAQIEQTLSDEATKDMMANPGGAANLVLYLDPAGPGNDGFGRGGADVDGDGTDDIVTFVRGRPADVYVALSTGSVFEPGVKWHDYFGAANEIPMLGDVNRDGRDDLITFTRRSRADVYVALSTGTSFGPATRWHDWFAVGNETPAVGDFDGDGRADIATFTRGAGADVYVALSDGTRFVGTGVRWSETLATGRSVPLVGDFTCDGRDDVAVFERGPVGRAFVAPSTGATFGEPLTWSISLVTGSQTPVVGDFDRDGCDDVAIVHRGDVPRVEVALSTGTRFGPPAPWHTGFAGGTAVPGAGDFDGDGRDDLVAFTRGRAADVYVALSGGSSFHPTVRRWSDWFGYGDEIPMPAVLW